MIQTENEGSPSMDKEKIQFMACLNLISPHAVKDILREMQTRKSERKRKSTANPQFCYFEPEMDRQEENCAVCHRSGELIICDECSLTYHLQCLSPPLTSVPSTYWLCPKCQVNNKKINDWPSNLALIHSYVMLKTAKEEEKKRLKKTIEELVEGKQALERETIKLKELLVLKLHEKCRLLENCNSAQRLLDAIQKFVLLVQS